MSTDYVKKKHLMSTAHVTFLNNSTKFGARLYLFHSHLADLATCDYLAIRTLLNRRHGFVPSGIFHADHSCSNLCLSGSQTTEYFLTVSTGDEMQKRIGTWTQL